MGLEPTTFRTTISHPLACKPLAHNALWHNNLYIAAILRQRNLEQARPNVNSKLTFLARFENSLYLCTVTNRLWCEVFEILCGRKPNNIYKPLCQTADGVRVLFLPITVLCTGTRLELFLNLPQCRRKRSEQSEGVRQQEAEVWACTADTCDTDEELR